MTAIIHIILYSVSVLYCVLPLNVAIASANRLHGSQCSNLTLRLNFCHTGSQRVMCMQIHTGMGKCTVCKDLSVMNQAKCWDLPWYDSRLQAMMREIMLQDLPSAAFFLFHMSTCCSSGS